MEFKPRDGHAIQGRENLGVQGRSWSETMVFIQNIGVSHSFSGIERKLKMRDSQQYVMHTMCEIFRYSQISKQ